MQVVEGPSTRESTSWNGFPSGTFQEIRMTTEYRTAEKNYQSPPKNLSITLSKHDFQFYSFAAKKFETV